MNKPYLYLLERMTEVSTVRGLVGLVTLTTGVAFTDAHIAAVVAVASAVDQILKIVLPDSFK